MIILALFIETNEYSCFGPVDLKAVNELLGTYALPSIIRHPEELLLAKLLVCSLSVEFIYCGEEAA